MKEIHASVLVYYSRLSKMPVETNEALKALSREEAERYNRFRFNDDKFRFLLARYLLKTFAPEIAGQRHHSNDITFNEFGKPHFKDSPLQFSISHSGDISAVAFSDSGCIGLDIEFHRNIDDMKALSSRFFSGKENIFLANCHDLEFRRNFFRIWSAKEAFLKASGTGVSTDLKSFSTVGKSGFSLSGSINEGRAYKLKEIFIEENYSSFICLKSNTPETAIDITLHEV